MVHVTARVRIAAPAAEIWPRITDHEGMPSWSPIKRVTLKQEGSPHRDGVGAIRVMHAVGPAIEEQVTAWEPESFYEYKLLRGAPIRDHLGRIELDERDGETEVVWRVRFRPVIPGTGWAIAAVLRRAFNGMLGRLRGQIEGTDASKG